MHKLNLIQTLKKLEGNPKYCVLTEPLWTIPYNLYLPYVSLYMYSFGINDAKIGLLLSIGMIFQVVAALFGGILTDKLGRRLTTLIFDIISWSIPTLLWAFAQNIWWFIAATILNSMWQVTNISWTCLLVEDCKESRLVNVYTWVQITGLLSVFFAPLTSFFVKEYSMQSTIRIVYLITSLSMTLKFIILYVKGHETAMGKQRQQQSKDRSILSMFKEYTQVFRKIFHHPQTFLIIALIVLYRSSELIHQSFFGLLVTQDLRIPAEYLAIFPMLKAIITLIIFFLLQNFFNRFPVKKVTEWGLLTLILSLIILILAPAQNLSYIFLHTFLYAVAFALIAPRLDSMLAWFVDKQDRARTLGIIYTLTITFAAPFPWLSGILSGINRHWPFIASIILITLALFLLLPKKWIHQHNEPTE